VGRLDVVKTFFKEDGNLKKSATQRQVECGFMWACEYGRTDVVDFLLQKGLKVDVMPHGETGLHWAAFTGRVDIVKRLLERKAPLDVKDKRHSGTPLDWALHAWSNPPFEAEHDRCYEIVALLTAAGSRVDPAWFNASRRSPLVEKMHSDPRMIAALRGEMLPQ
jgi:hypothetical protein